MSANKVFYAPHITLRVLSYTDFEKYPSAFSFVVSSKVARKATERNRLKRRGYAIIQKQFECIKPNHNCVFFFKKHAAELSFKDVEQEITTLLIKAKILHA